ncbi:hypothetical protein [Marinomonas pollencensis]|uniref:DUF2383 domain-containing protein n=1 Tax=Marinomonas pollencensis TaxID=491954 RepID=A0A3E0DTD5_9GAMM|nr:hypothetical protein [Marinomonas pollencensis]REG86656.1 hypothetical protein DFP81_101221 [Marinomonas pollencensis]
MTQSKATMPTYSEADARLMLDIFSISFDSSVANATLYARSTNTLEQHVFQRVATQYRALSDSLLSRLMSLPKDSGTMNVEAGYIAKAYLMALKSSNKHAPSRVMSVNRQSLKRIRKMLRRITDRAFVGWLSQYLAWIQLTLDHVQYQRNAMALEQLSSMG